MRNPVRLPLFLTLALSLAACDFNGGANMPAPPGGVYLADAGGGTGGTARTSDGNGGFLGDGGNGGEGIEVSSFGGGRIELLVDERADASFTSVLPAVSGDLGSHPAIFTADTIITFGPPEGTSEAYFTSADNSNRLMHRTAGGQLAVVTGIRVERGVTVTVEPGNYYDVGAALTVAGEAGLGFRNAAVIAGTLRTAALDEVHAGGLHVSCSGPLVVEPTGIVETGGLPGQAPGLLALYSGGTQGLGGGLLLNRGTVRATGDGTDGGSIRLASEGYTVNLGTVESDGSDGASNGHAGGDVTLYAYGRVYNEGTVSARGGRGADLNGGNGGHIVVSAWWGRGFLKGSFTASGGQGGDRGGDGGSFDADNGGGGGDFITSARIDVAGGRATGAEGDSQGGHGGMILFLCGGGNLVNAGDLSADGGSADPANLRSLGGNAGTIEFSLDQGTNPTAAAARLDISGNLSARGGSANSGGAGGAIRAEYGTDSVFGGDLQLRNLGGIRFLGYSKLAASGGDGASGGMGAPIVIETYGNSRPSPLAPPGAIVNESALASDGGRGFDGDGGHSADGRIWWLSTDGIALRTNEGDLVLTGEAIPWGTVTNRGAVSMRGGTGTGQGGHGGIFYAYGAARLENRGDIDVSGGESISGAGGGAAGSIQFLSTSGDVYSGATLTANGGDGPVHGGDAGMIVLDAQFISADGAASANGGDASPVLTPGSGGYVYLRSMREATRTALAVSVRRGAGAGDSDGVRDGAYTVDGIVILAGG